MDNRFKFRAWEKATKKLWPHAALDSYVLVSECPKADAGTYGDVHGYAYNNCVVMQCTGLTDKNGVDIYEGDIIRVVADDYDPPLEFEVEWDDEKLGFVLLNVSGDWDWGDMYSPDDMLVVGNIYEGENKE